MVYRAKMEEQFNPITTLLGDSSLRLVFPSEISARFWRHRAVTGGYAKAVSARRFISWDRFKEEAFGLRETRKPVNGKIRRLFAYHLAEEQKVQPFLSQLLPRGTDSSTGSVAELIRLLPRLHTVLPAIAERKWPLADDIRLLADRYTLFLNEKGLYEPSLLTPDLETLEDTFVLCFPETLEDYSQYRNMLEGHSKIQILGVSDPPSPKITLYPDQREETSVLFSKIRSLLAEGVPPEEITITCPDIQKNRRYLEEYAHHYGLPLRFHTGRKLSEYSSVRMFRLLAETVSSSFSMDAVKNLLLNNALPWKELPRLRKLIQDGIETYVLRNWRDKEGAHGWEEQLRLGGKKESLELYRRLESSIRRIVSSPDFQEAGVRIQAFAGTFLDTSRWEESAVSQLKAFQRALEELNEFAETEAQYPELKPASPYSIWIASLEENSYVEQQPVRGISVYPYRATAGIHPSRHFIPFLTQNASRVTWDRGYPLNESQRRECGITDDDVSGIYLKLYLQSGTETIISCHEAGYTGPGLSPGYFVEARTEYKPAAEDAPDDPEEADIRFFNSTFKTAGERRLLPAPWQREGFLRFMETGGRPEKRTFLETPIPHAGLAEAVVQRFAESGDNGAISPTDLDAFWSCPFAFLFQRILGLNREEYAVIVRDHRKEGILLHAVLEEFSAGMAGKQFLAAETEEYRQHLEEIFLRVTASMREPLPIKPAWEASLEQMEQQLTKYPAAEAALFDGYTVMETEKKLGGCLQGIAVGGRVDRVSRGPAGEVLIIDYKKGLSLTAADMKPAKGAPASMQIPFYALLLQAKGICRQNDDLITGYFVASQGKFRIVSSSVPLPSSSGVRVMLKEDEFSALLCLTEEYIATMKKRVDRGDFRMSPEDCAPCGLRNLCRGRYVIKGEQ